MTPDRIHKLWLSGPFFMKPRWLYRLGFDWQEDMELQDGWTRATWEVPAWANSDGIVGTWKPLRKRLVWKPFGLVIIPVGRWKAIECATG